MKQKQIWAIILACCVLCSGLLLLPANAQAYRLGDPDNDGVISVKDATYTQKHLADIVNFSEAERTAADVDRDTIVAVTDVTLIQKHVADLITEFPDFTPNTTETITGSEISTESTVVESTKSSDTDPTDISPTESTAPTNTETEPSEVTEEPSTEIMIPLNFTITVPSGSITSSDKLVLAGTMNNWNPVIENWTATRVNSTTYTFQYNVPAAQAGTVIKYKVVKIKSNMAAFAWTYVEGSAAGAEISDRSYTVKASGNDIKITVASFRDTSDEGNVTSSGGVTGGTLTTVTLNMTQYSPARTRTIRIWTPTGYTPGDKTKKYPVLYMHDAQNLFDPKTSFAGEWCVDESMKAMMESGYSGTIIVGIDNSSYRMTELVPSVFSGSSSDTGELYARFITETVKPYIDTNYNTYTDTAHTGIGGSSLGGLESLYMVLQHKETFGYGLCFSVSGQMFKNDAARQNFFNGLHLSADTASLPKIFLYCGGSGGEGSITKYVDLIKNELLAEGYPAAKINTLIDTSQQHTESAWAKYFPAAYKWCVGIS